MPPGNLHDNPRSDLGKRSLPASSGATVKNRVKIAFRAIFPHKTLDRPEMLCYSMCYLSCERFLFVRFFTRKGRLRTYREAMPAPLGPGK